MELRHADERMVDGVRGNFHAFQLQQLFFQQIAERVRFALEREDQLILGFFENGEFHTANL